MPRVNASAIFLIDLFAEHDRQLNLISLKAILSDSGQLIIEITVPLRRGVSVWIIALLHTSTARDYLKYNLMCQCNRSAHHIGPFFFKCTRRAKDRETNLVCLMQVAVSA